MSYSSLEKAASEEAEQEKGEDGLDTKPCSNMDQAGKRKRKRKRKRKS